MKLPLLGSLLQPKHCASGAAHSDAPHKGHETSGGGNVEHQHGPRWGRRRRRRHRRDNDACSREARNREHPRRRTKHGVEQARSAAATRVPATAPTTTQLAATPTTTSAVPAVTAGGSRTALFTPSSVPAVGSGVRDPQAAAANLAMLKQQMAKFQDPSAARAAGYTQNPNHPDHWHNFNIYENAEGRDLAHPASLMYDTSGKLTGVMIGHPKGQTPPDFGAGSWHGHGDSDDLQHLHVWFDKPLDQAYGQESGNM